jgi:hypothetical protein
MVLSLFQSRFFVPSIVSSHHARKGSKKYLIGFPSAGHEPFGRLPPGSRLDDICPVAGLLHPAAPFPGVARESAENSVICATHCSVAAAAPRLNLRCVIFVTAIRAMKIALGRGANDAWGIDLRFDG